MYVLMGLSMVAAVVVGVMYADTSRELKVLDDLNATVPGEFGSAFSNATQTLTLLALKFSVEMMTYWAESLSGRLRGYSSKWKHVPFFLGRSGILAVGAANVLPILLASSAPKGVAIPSLFVLSVMNYRSVALLMDKFWFFIRRISGQVTSTEKEAHYMMSQFKKFWDKEATPDQKQILLELVLSKTSQNSKFQDELSVLTELAQKVVEIKTQVASNFIPAGFFSEPLEKESPCELPSCASLLGVLLRGTLSTVFVTYCLQQYPSIVWGIHKALGWVAGQDVEVLEPNDRLGQAAFWLGLVSMSVALARCFDWAVIQLFPALVQVREDIRGAKTTTGKVIKSMGAFVATGITAISTGGSIEAAVKGVENLSHMAPGPVLGPIFDWLQAGGPFIRYAPAYISGFSMNLTGNIQIAFKAMGLVDYYDKLYRLPDAEIESYLRSLEYQAFGEILDAMVSNIKDGRHFSEQDLKAIVDAVSAGYTNKGDSEDVVGDALSMGLLTGHPKTLDQVRERASERASQRWKGRAPGLLFWRLEQQVGGKLLEAPVAQEPTV
jgi:hypothetical protein